MARQCWFLDIAVNRSSPASTGQTGAIGLILLVVSLLSLCTCLVLLVKLLQSMLKGTISTVIFKTVNADFPGIFRHLTPYLAIGVNLCFES